MLHQNSDRWHYKSILGDEHQFWNNPSFQILHMYKCCLIKTEQFEKKIFFRNCYVFTTMPSKYSPLSATYFIQRFCHLSSLRWNRFRTKHFKAVSTAPTIACGGFKTVPLEVSLTCRKQGKITVCDVWAVGSAKKHFRTMWGQEIPKYTICGRCYCDATSIDNYDNVTSYTGYAP